VARGKLLSRNPEKIVEQVRMQLARGIGEVRISSLDTAAYGKDISFRLPGLVNRITSLQGNFRLRVGMMEPKNTFEILDDLIDAYSSSRVFKFLHLPVQSGDDRILDSMNREYDAGTFYKIVEAYRRNFPDSTLSTDIISGYPGDDQESFENTLRLIERTRPEVINITRFSPRQFTRDFERKTPESNLVKRWTSEYSKLHRSLTSSIFQSHIGSLKEIFTTERVKEGTTLGRDSAYRPVVLPGNLPLYSTFEAEIVDSTDNYLIGKTIN
jgi:MiaB/RimO family radical SAM methylthiotransferase